jgi:GxxExxY protein
MNTDEHGCLNSLTENVLAAVFGVSNTLGAGFLQKVYERALLMELRARGIRATGQTSLAVKYKGHAVGKYFAGILVEDVLAARGQLKREVPRGNSTFILATDEH